MIPYSHNGLGCVCPGIFFSWLVYSVLLCSLGRKQSVDTGLVLDNDSLFWLDSKHWNEPNIWFAKIYVIVWDPNKGCRFSARRIMLFLGPHYSSTRCSNDFDCMVGCSMHTRWFSNSTGWGNNNNVKAANGNGISQRAAAHCRRPLSSEDQLVRDDKRAGSRYCRDLKRQHVTCL